LKYQSKACFKVDDLPVCRADIAAVERDIHIHTPFALTFKSPVSSEVNGSLATFLPITECRFYFYVTRSLRVTDKTLFVLIAFFMYAVPLCWQYTSGKVMVYSLPYSQVKPTCFVAS
jgi:hypothetical protein